MRTKLYKFFETNGIYAGAIDTIWGYDEDDEMIAAGYLVCFSNHDSRLTIPLDVLIALKELCVGYNIQIEQRGCKECGKELYMYIRIYNPKYEY